MLALIGLSAGTGGGGIQGGQAYGKTSEDGREVVEQKTDETAVLATLCKATGIDPEKENMTRLGRPIKVIEGEPITALLSGQQLAENGADAQSSGSSSAE